MRPRCRRTRWRQIILSNYLGGQKNVRKGDSRKLEDWDVRKKRSSVSVFFFFYAIELLLFNILHHADYLINDQDKLMLLLLFSILHIMHMYNWLQKKIYLRFHWNKEICIKLYNSFIIRWYHENYYWKLLTICRIMKLKNSLMLNGIWIEKLLFILLKGRVSCQSGKTLSEYKEIYITLY